MRVSLGTVLVLVSVLLISDLLGTMIHEAIHYADYLSRGATWIIIEWKWYEVVITGNPVIPSIMPNTEILPYAANIWFMVTSGVYTCRTIMYGRIL